MRNRNLRMSAGLRIAQSNVDSPRSRKRNCQRGASILEAALLLPVLLLMLFGAMDLARVFVAGIVVESAARAGVQYGSYSVGKTATSGMDTAASEDASGQGFTGLATSSRTFCGCNSGTGEVSCSTGTCDGKIPSVYAESTATYTFTPIVPYPGIPASVLLSSTARFRVQ